MVIIFSQVMFCLSSTLGSKVWSMNLIKWLHLIPPWLLTPRPCPMYAAMAYNLDKWTVLYLNSSVFYLCLMIATILRITRRLYYVHFEEQTQQCGNNKTQMIPYSSEMERSGSWNVVFFVQDNTMGKVQAHNNLKCNVWYTNCREINSHYNEWITQKRISSLKWNWKQNSVSECIQLINSMEQKYYWKSTSHSASHKILHLLFNPTVWTRSCITTCPSSIFCTSSSTQLFSVSKILVLRERKFDNVITKKHTYQVQTQDFHRHFQKCPVAGLGNSGHMRRGSMVSWLYLLRVKYRSSDISVQLQSSGPIFTNIFIIHIYIFPTQQQ